MSTQDADIEITISDDGLIATVTGYTQEQDGGVPFSAERLAAAMLRAGIKTALDPALQKQLLESTEYGIDITGIILAKGRAPVPATDATITPIGNLAYPVFPGDIFCEIIPAKPSIEGLTVTGIPIKPAGNAVGKNILLPSSPGCHIDTTTLQVRSETYGLVFFENQTLSVRPLLHIANVGMTVLATLYPYDSAGNIISAQRMEEALQALKITAPLNRSSFAAAMQTTISYGIEELNVPIAHGIEPTNGKNGWFELYIKDERTDVGTETDKGKVDFRSRGTIRSVQADMIIGKLHAPTRGKPGKDVYGKVIPAHDGAAFRITLGENVEATETGSEFKALIAGMVFFNQNILSVTEVFMTPGDVNMATGNLQLEKGSVHVRGAVLSGFAIECPRNVLVNDVVESATIIAGGDVEVKGGIIMDKGGRITAKGGVSALFAKGATIEAQGDIHIAHELDNCIVFAGQSVITTKGRGKIVGSTIRCGGSIIANEVGSDLGVPTTLFLGFEQEFTDFTPRKKELNTILQKVYSSLGTGDPRTILENTPAPHRKSVAQLLKVRISAENELREIEEQIVNERAEWKKNFNSKLKVHRTIHPGTIVHSNGLIFKVKSPIEHSCIRYSHDDQKIIVTSL